MPADYATIPCSLPHSGNRRPNGVEDSAGVFTARTVLLATLDSVAAQIPGDGWVAGQRVWYLMFAGELDRALAAARGCAADTGWCMELRGYVLVRGGHAESGLAVFDSARRVLPASARCSLDDVSLLLDDDAARTSYGAMPCGSPERAAFEDRFWWLSAPSWLLPLNDRRAEDYARMVERTVTLEWGGTICGDCPRGPLADAVTTPDESVRTGPHTEWAAWMRKYDMQSV